LTTARYLGVVGVDRRGPLHVIRDCDGGFAFPTKLEEAAAFLLATPQSCRRSR